MDNHVSPAFEIRNLGKSFGAHPVLRDFSLSINTGDFLLLLGANGAGKTTLLRICAGLSRPDRGEVLLQGKVPEAKDQKKIGHAGHQLFLYGNLSVQENIELFSRLADAPLAVEDYLRQWHLYEERKKRVFELSKGIQYRLSLCRAWITQPQFVFLDEPTSSLDEASTKLLVSRTMQVCKNGGFVLIATHDVRRLRDYANRLVVLEDGKISKDLGELCQAQPEADLEGLKEEVVSHYLERNR